LPIILITEILKAFVSIALPLTVNSPEFLFGNKLMSILLNGLK